MSHDDWRRRLALVRQLPLESVLISWGAERDRHDRSKWQTERGPLSVTSTKFMNWHAGLGGGGAIDLVMHLGNMDCRAAVVWLEQQFGFTLSVQSVSPSAMGCASPSRAVALGTSRPFQLPPRDDRRLERVRRYLTLDRHLPTARVDPLIVSGKVYAGARANAVFVMVAGKAQRPVGAELRGTGPRVWRGMATGSSKDGGYFWVGDPLARQIVLCESAIDAISSWQLHPDSISISTAGVRSNPRWLPVLLARGYDILCGFDADPAGDAAARQMMARYPSIVRLRPSAHDWNDALAVGL